MNDWGLTLFSGGGITLLTGIGWMIIRTIKHQTILTTLVSGFDDFKKNHSAHGIDIAVLKTYEHRLLRLEAYYDAKTNSKIKDAQSPLSLTPYAKALLKEIGFDPLFNEIKDGLVKEIEKHPLRTRYDIQEMADFIVRKMSNDTIFDKLKGAVYDKGQRWEEVIAAISIPLRDYYLAIHPEIKD